MTAVQLKHVHAVRARLANGSVAVYHYAWKGRGAPRLPGEPGSAEYLKAYVKAHETRKRPTSGDMRALVAAYKGSPDYLGLGAHSKRAYGKYLDLILAEFGEATFSVLDDDKMAGEFWEWRDAMGVHPRSADYAVGVLKTLLNWGRKRKRFNHQNQAESIERLHSVDRSESVWTDAELLELAKHGSAELLWAVRLAAFTGLRQGDLIRLVWSHYNGDSFELRTSKRGKTVLIPAVQACRDLMTEIRTARRSDMIVLTTERGRRPWTADGLRSSFRKACGRAGIKRTFHDLRRTAATRLVAAGHPSSAVALIMGWEEDAVEALKRKYVSRSAVVESMLARVAEND